MATAAGAGLNEEPAGDNTLTLTIPRRAPLNNALALPAASFSTQALDAPSHVPAARRAAVLSGRGLTRQS